MRSFVKQLIARYLAFWARLVLAERKPKIVGVTGSVGKTTTKEAIAAVLQHATARSLLGWVEKSSGNLNTEVGLPLAVLLYKSAPRSVLGWLLVLMAIPVKATFLAWFSRYPTVLVLEYAADQPGDISRLARLAPPTVGVVTAVGPAHLERFKTLAAIVHEKAELVRALLPSGLAILGKDNQYTSNMSADTQARAILVAGRGTKLAQGVAKSVGAFFGLHDATIRQGLEKFVAVSGRLETKSMQGLDVIDDTYNANPLSMMLALDTLTETAKPSQRRVAFLGTMRELGEASDGYHIEIGAYARDRADLVIGVGPYAQLYDGMAWYPTSADAAAHLDEWIKPGDILLIKGSRGIRMEVIIQVLQAQVKESRGNH